MFTKHKPHARRPPKGPKMSFLSAITLTFDPDIETHLSEVANTPSM